MLPIHSLEVHERTPLSTLSKLSRALNRVISSTPFCGSCSKCNRGSSLLAAAATAAAVSISVCGSHMCCSSRPAFCRYGPCWGFSAAFACTELSKLKNQKYSILLTAYSLISIAHVPSVEGLFRRVSTKHTFGGKKQRRSTIEFFLYRNTKNGDSNAPNSGR